MPGLKDEPCKTAADFPDTSSTTSPSAFPSGLVSGTCISMPRSTSSLRRLTILPNKPIDNGKGAATAQRTAAKMSALRILDGGLAFWPAFSASWMRMKHAPSSWPPVQQIVLPISGEKGYVISTRYSSTMGKRAKEEAPMRAKTTKDGAMPAGLGGAKIRPMYEATMIGTSTRIEPR